MLKKIKNISAISEIEGVIADLIVPAYDTSIGAGMTRLDYLIRAVRGKRVLHLGCCDHIGLIEQKISDGTWLHGLLQDNASECYGIDNDKEAVDYLTAKGYQNIYCADMTKEIPEKVKNKHFDIMILGELLEHINDPVSFLVQLHASFDYDYKLIITVPNAFFLENFKNILGHFERINSDHRYWFTPYTISKICILGHYYPVKIDFVFRGEPIGYGRGSELEMELYKNYPAVRDVLLVEAFSKSSPAAGITRPTEVTREELDELFCYSSSPKSVERKSVLKQIFLLMERNLPQSVFDTNLVHILKETLNFHRDFMNDRYNDATQKNVELQAKLDEMMRQNKKLAVDSSDFEAKFKQAVKNLAAAECSIQQRDNQLKQLSEDNAEKNATLEKLRNDIANYLKNEMAADITIQKLNRQTRDSLVLLTRKEAELSLLREQLQATENKVSATVPYVQEPAKNLS